MKFLKLAGYEPRKLWSFGYVRFLFVLLLAVNMLSAFIYCDESLYIESNSEYSYTREDVFYVHSLYENDPEWFEDAYKVIVNKWEEWEGDVQPESFYSKCDWYTFEHVYKDVHAYENYVSDIEKTLKMGVRFREMLGFMPQYPGLYPNFTVARTENAVAFSASNLFTSISVKNKSPHRWCGLLFFRGRRIMNPSVRVRLSDVYVSPSHALRTLSRSRFQICLLLYP